MVAVEGREVAKGGRVVWEVYEPSLLAHLRGQPWTSYQDLVEEWERDQASGYHTGKALAVKSILANSNGMARFWKYLGQPPDVSRITVENLRRALSAVPIDRQKTCHYTLRDQMYKGFRSFYKLLIRKGLGGEETLVKVASVKPKRVVDAKRPVVRANHFEAFLVAAKTPMRGKTLKESILTETLLYMLGEGGLRREEAVSVLKADLDLHNGCLRVVGKNRKERTVGLTPGLEAQLRRWLEVRPQTDTETLIVSLDGRRMAPDALYDRIRRLSKKAGHTFTPHAFRRHAATQMVTTLGLSIAEAQKMLGHSASSITDLYVSPDETEAIRKMRQQPDEGKGKAGSSYYRRK